MPVIRPALVALAVNAALLAWPSAALTGLPSSRVTPNPSAPGTATRFDVFCGPTATSATLSGTTFGLFRQIPMRAAGTRAGDFVVTVTLPASTAPGTYSPTIDCSNGNSGTVTFRVNLVLGQGAPARDGATSTQTGPSLVAVGVAAMGLGVLAGGLALSRRRARARG